MLVFFDFDCGVGVPTLVVRLDVRFWVVNLDDFTVAGVGVGFWFFWSPVVIRECCVDAFVELLWVGAAGAVPAFEVFHHFLQLVGRGCAVCCYARKLVSVCFA